VTQILTYFSLFIPYVINKSPISSRKTARMDLWFIYLSRIFDGPYLLLIR